MVIFICHLQIVNLFKETPYLRLSFAAGWCFFFLVYPHPPTFLFISHFYFPTAPFHSAASWPPIPTPSPISIPPLLHAALCQVFKRQLCLQMG